MARRRFRDPDPAVRDRNKWDAAGQPAVAGLSRIGGGGGGPQTINVRGGRGDGGQVRIEHVTLHAQTSQTVASGGAGVVWDRIAAAPTEIRGFATCADTIASTGQVVAIPIDITGVLNFILEGRWASWLGTGTLTVTRIRDGVETPRVYDLARTVATMEFGGDDDGWEVAAGDHMRYALSNGSGVGQVLAEATLVQKIIGVADPTGRAGPLETVWLDEEVNDSASPVTSTTVLESGVLYEIVVTGNARHHADSETYETGTPDTVLFPSTTPGSGSQAGFDYETQYAQSADTHPGEQIGHRVPTNIGTNNNGQIEIDLGSGFSHIEPAGGPFSTPSPGHVYTLRVTGEGSTMSIRTTDTPIDDNNGRYRFVIYRASS